MEKEEKKQPNRTSRRAFRRSLKVRRLRIGKENTCLRCGLHSLGPTFARCQCKVR